MWVILSLLFGSIVVGTIVRKCGKTVFVKRFSDRTSLTVLLMLFVFGITIGGNEEIMAEIGQLGFTAFVISSACILGSVLFALLIDKCHIIRKKGGRNER